MNESLRRAILAAIVILAVSGGASRSAVAQQDDREVKAREAFGMGRYADALAVYGKLYAETAHPTYLRNIGRCYQNLGEADKAISSFREYLRQAGNLPADQRTQVEGYIREMEALKAARAGARSAASPPAAPASVAPPVALAPRVPGAPAQPPASAGVRPAPDGAASMVEASREAPLPTRTAAYWVGGGGLALVAVSAAFGIRALSQRHESDAECPTDMTCSRKGVGLNEAAQSSARWCDVFGGAGVIALGAATYLYFRRPGAEPGARVALRTELDVRSTPSGALLTLSRRW